MQEVPEVGGSGSVVQKSGWRRKPESIVEELKVPLLWKAPEYERMGLNENHRPRNALPQSSARCRVDDRDVRGDARI